MRRHKQFEVNVGARWLRCGALVASLLVALFLPAQSRAQAVPAGFESRRSLWAGAECSYIYASFPYGSGQRIYGCGGFADLRWSSHWDAEMNARWLPFGTYANSTETNYLAGPRYLFNRFGKFQPYAKFLVGDGEIQYPYGIGSKSYFALAPGGGVNYRVARRWTIRLDYEYQIWHNSPGFAGEPDHTLTPNGLHLGVAYRAFYF